METVLNLYVQCTYMATKKVNFRLPDELVDKTDTVAEISHRSRTDIIKEALQDYFEQVEDDEKFKQEITDLYLEEEISFEVLKEFIGKQDAEAVKASKHILEDSEQMAEDLANL